MEPFQVGIIALIAVLVLLANRVPIAAALGIVASLGIFMIFAWRPGQDFLPQYAIQPTLSLMTNSPYAFITSSTLSTVPLFILMGHLAYEAGFTTDIHARRGFGLCACRAGWRWPRWWVAAVFLR